MIEQTKETIWNFPKLFLENITLHQNIMAISQSHEGIKLKKLIEKKSLVVSKIAQKMGYKKSQNLEYYFGVAKIKDDVLRKILEIIEYPYENFKGIEKQVSTNDFEQMKAERDEWKEKYYELLERHNACLENANILNKKFKLKQGL